MLRCAYLDLLTSWLPCSCPVPTDRSPRSLKSRVSETMNDQLNKTLNELGLSELLPLFEGQDIDDSVLGDLSDADLKDIGIDKLGARKKLLAAFGKPGGGGTATALVAEQSAPQRGLSAAPPTTATTPAEATKNSPWVNTLGMPFVPIPRFDTRFCIWPVRVQDYEAYCMASGAKFPEIPFPQGSDHPIVGVSWNDAIEFCVWLTSKERGEGKIDDKTVYRLPTDLEWSAAVGLPHEPETTPAERHLKAPGYPWGLRWPPPENEGNYEDTRVDQLRLVAGAVTCELGVEADKQFDIRQGIDQSDDRSYKTALQVAAETRKLAAKWKAEWSPVDRHLFTSPSVAFNPNNFGIFDLGGNIWEWCMDYIGHQGDQGKTARGGSFSLSPLFGLSGEREVYLGDWVSTCPGMPDQSRHQYERLNILNSEVYRSSYRHFGPADRPLTSQEYEKFIPREWGEVLCGGFRIVIAAC